MSLEINKDSLKLLWKNSKQWLQLCSLFQAAFFQKTKPKYLSIGWYRSTRHKNDGECLPVSQERASVQGVMFEKCLLTLQSWTPQPCGSQAPLVRSHHSRFLLFPATAAVASPVCLAPPGLTPSPSQWTDGYFHSLLAEIHSLLHRPEHQHFSFYFRRKSNPKLGFHPSACDVQRQETLWFSQSTPKVILTW